MSEFPSLAGKVVLVTGGSSGIGRATALAYGRNGAKVVLGDLDAGAAATASTINEAGGEALFVKTDVSEEASVQALVEAAVEAHGRLDIAFNNAGLLPHTADLADMTLADFDRTIAVDLRGVFLCLKYEIAQMLKNGGGAIVNTASVAGLVADPGMSPYGKAADRSASSRVPAPSTLKNRAQDCDLLLLPIRVVESPSWPETLLTCMRIGLL